MLLALSRKSIPASRARRYEAEEETIKYQFVLNRMQLSDIPKLLCDVVILVEALLKGDWSFTTYILPLKECRRRTDLSLLST